MKVLHVFDHSLPLQSGYTFRSLAILREQRRHGWQTLQLTSGKQGKAGADEEVGSQPGECDKKEHGSRDEPDRRRHVIQGGPEARPRGSEPTCHVRCSSPGLPNLRPRAAHRLVAH